MDKLALNSPLWLAQTPHIVGSCQFCGGILECFCPPESTFLLLFYFALLLHPLFFEKLRWSKLACYYYRYFLRACDPIQLNLQTVHFSQHRNPIAQPPSFYYIWKSVEIKFSGRKCFKLKALMSRCGVRALYQLWQLPGQGGWHWMRSVVIHWHGIHQFLVLLVVPHCSFACRTDHIFQLTISCVYLALYSQNACECGCLCSLCVCVFVLRIFSRDKILCYKNTIIIILCPTRQHRKHLFFSKPWYFWTSSFH